MDKLDIILAIISVVSFLIAIYSLVRSKILETNEQAKIDVIQERLGSLHQAMVLLFHSADALVQIPKRREVDINEMQDHARFLRAQAFLLSKKLHNSRSKVKEWRYGNMIESDEYDDKIDLDEIINMKNKKQDDGEGVSS